MGRIEAGMVVHVHIDSVMMYSNHRPIPMTKAHVINEIRRTTQANAGVPLGSRAFATATGITERDWKGKLWARWSDALGDAGYAPNKLTQAYDKPELLEKFAAFAKEIRKLPAAADIRLRNRAGGSLPEWDTVAKHFGEKSKLVAALREFCASRPEYAEVIEMCDNYAPRRAERVHEFLPSTGPLLTVGYVYLIRHGSRREYKIGRTNNALRREGEIAVELPERVQPIHVIETDDPAGIEAYWHRRFADKRKNGEWFELGPVDVAAFKRRRFM